MGVVKHSCKYTFVVKIVYTHCIGMNIPEHSSSSSTLSPVFSFSIGTRGGSSGEAHVDDGVGSWERSSDG